MRTSASRFARFIVEGSLRASETAEEDVLRLRDRNVLATCADGQVWTFGIHGRTEADDRPEDFTLNLGDIAFTDDPSVTKRWHMLRRALVGAVQRDSQQRGWPLLGNYVLKDAQTLQLELQVTVAGDLLFHTSRSERTFVQQGEGIVLISPSGRKAQVIRQYEAPKAYQQTLCDQLLVNDDTFLLLRLLDTGELLVWPETLVFVEVLHGESPDQWFYAPDPIPLEDHAADPDIMADVAGPSEFNFASPSSSRSSKIADGDFTFFDEKSAEEILGYNSPETSPAADPYAPGGKFFVDEISSSESSPEPELTLEQPPSFTVANVLLPGETVARPTSSLSMAYDLQSLHQNANMLAEELAFSSSRCSSRYTEASLVSSLEALLGLRSTPMGIDDFNALYEDRRSKPRKAEGWSSRQVTVRTQDGEQDIDLAALSYWEELGLQPPTKKDITTVALYPDGELMRTATLRLLDDLAGSYSSFGSLTWDATDNGMVAYPPELSSEMPRLSAAILRRTERQLCSVLVLVVNVFDEGDPRFTRLLDVVRQVRSTLQRRGNVHHIALSIVHAASIADPGKLVVMSSVDLLRLARRIYDRTVSVDASIDPTCLSALSVRLCPPVMAEVGSFVVTAEELPSLPDEHTKMHLAYRSDSDWVTSAWQDGAARVFCHREFASQRGRSMAATLVDMWRTTMRLCSVYPVVWHVVVCKVGSMTEDELEAWQQMVKLDKSGVKCILSVTTVNLEPGLQLQKELREEDVRLRMTKPLSPPFLALKLSRYQPCADGPPSSASAYLVSFDRSLQPRTVLWHALKLCNDVDDLIQSWRDLSALFGELENGEYLPRHVAAVDRAHRVLSRLPWTAVASG
ncbi:hypothetical protein PYCC9005_003263 [Savitreella phatthalungensis]